MAGRWLAAVLMLAVAMTAGSYGVTPAYSQEGSFLQRLFGGDRRSRVVEPETRRPVVRQRRPQSRPAPVRAAPAVDKNEDARVVLVVGDFLAAGLAEGLESTFAEAPDVRIVNRSNGSSGFVRDDHYDWPSGIAELIETEKPAVVVLLIGANDGQQMRLPDGRVEALSEQWSKAYQERATAFAEAVRGKGVPMLWVGTPSFKLGRLSSYMVAFNETFKTVGAATGAEFIDIWDGFVDENGAFVTTGPDVKGQQVRLRANDGINMTQAGRQKMAFYVEKPLRRILGDPAQPIIGSLYPDGGPEAGGQPHNPANVERTPPISLNDPELDGGSELLGANAAMPAPNGEKSPRDRLVIDGLAPDPQPGRADAFAAAPAGGGGVAAVRRTGVEATNSITP